MSNAEMHATTEKTTTERTDLPPLEWGELELVRLLRRLPAEVVDSYFNSIRLWLVGESDIPDESLRPLEFEPHALGWVHQHQGERRRVLAFAEHHRAEAKHFDSTSTTQLFTPSWVAHILAESCFVLAGATDMLDPACGSGQMLLAWVDVLIKNGTPARAAFEKVHGVDLDPDAVRTCRQVMQLHARRILGEQVEGLEEVFEANITHGDGLFGAVRPASVVITNPPYMGTRSMPKDTREALRAFAPFDGDLSSAFIRRCVDLATTCTAVLAQQSFWYVRQFEEARKSLLNERHLDTFVHFGPGVFRALSGEKASVVGFVMDHGEGPTKFHDLRKGKAEEKRNSWNSKSAKKMDVSRFDQIPGNPIAHWLSDPLIAEFSKMPRLGDFFEIPPQNKTGKNSEFVRKMDQIPDNQIIGCEIYHEEDLDKLATWAASKENWISAELPCEANWALYSKGGPAAPWWGNWDNAVNLSLEARTFYRTNRTSNLVGHRYVFRKGITYTDFGGLQFSARAFPAGAVADMTGPAIFSIDDNPVHLNAAMAVLNSSAPRALLNAMNPTLHYQVRDVRNLPFPEPGNWCFEISPLVETLVVTVRSLLAQAESSTERRFGISPSDDFETLRRLEHQIEAMISALYGVSSGECATHQGLKALKGFR
jgi:methylase of polypeptide subunit release factors